MGWRKPMAAHCAGAVVARRWTATRGLGALAAACIALAAPAFAQDLGQPIRIKGSNTIGAELMPALLQGFAEANGWRLQNDVSVETKARLAATAYQGERPVFTVALERLGSSTSFAGLADGSADIGMSSRVIKAQERAALETGAVDMRDENSEHVVALDGLAVIVSNLNPQLTVTPQEIAQIFSGEIKDWSELGQTSRPIVVHARDDQSGTFDTFESLALEPFDKKISQNAFRYFSNAEIATKVAADPNAIGFVPLAFTEGVKALSLSLECGLIVTPDEFSVKSEEYPLGRRLHLYTRGAPPGGLVADLVAFAKSDAAQPVVTSVGFVNQSLARQSAAAFSNHIVSAMGLTQNADQSRDLKRLFEFSGDSERLSLTFRFSSADPSAQDILDSKSISDARRLVRWMSQNQGAKVLLMGFGGDAETSRLRAEAARRAVLIHAEFGFRADQIETYGFGPVAPVACPSAEGQVDRNHRVEVWVAGDRG